MQFRYHHLVACHYDMGYGQSLTFLGTSREGTLASLAYATGCDAKFSRNESNSPVPTSLSQNAAQSHGAAFITPAEAASSPLTPAYAHYYSDGVMPGSYKCGAPTVLHPVSAAACHAGGAGNPFNRYGKKGVPFSRKGASGTAGSQSGGQTGQVISSGGNASAGVDTGQSYAAGATSGGAYASYGSTYDEFSKYVNGSVSSDGQATQMGGGSGELSSGTACSGADMSYGKTQHQLGKINTYDKTGGFHTVTSPPYGMAANASGAPIGVVVEGPSHYGGQHIYIPTLVPHLMYQQLHQDSNSGQGQHSQGGGQQNKQGSKPSYGRSYWGSN